MYQSYTKAQRWSFLGLALAAVFNGILMGGNVVRENYNMALLNGFATLFPILVLTFLLLKDN